MAGTAAFHIELWHCDKYMSDVLLGGGADLYEVLSVSACPAARRGA